MRKKVLHLIDDLSVGGAQRLVVNLAAAGRDFGYETLVRSLQRADDLLGDLLALGVNARVLGRTRPSIRDPLNFLSYALGSVRDVGRVLRREKVDVLHCHLSDAELLGVATGRLRGVKRLAVTVHTPRLMPARNRFDPRAFLRRRATGFLLNRADAVAAVSEETAEALVREFGVRRELISVIATGVDVSPRVAARPANLPAEVLSADAGPILLIAARLAPPKGHAALIAAMAPLARELPGVRLLCAGEGGLRPELEALRDSLGLGGHVFFLGARNDVPDLLGLCDVFLLPSLWEGTPLALLEAMAAAKPIVSTDIPGIRDVLASGRDSLLVPPGDPEALAAAVLTLVRDAALGERLGRAAREEVVERFSIQAVFRQYAALWEPGTNANAAAKTPS